jgi:hypothetical protein
MRVLEPSLLSLSVGMLRSVLNRFDSEIRSNL